MSAVERMADAIIGTISCGQLTPCGEERCAVCWSQAHRAARNALSALAEPEGMEEAVMAAARARQNNSGQFPGRPVTEAFIEQARFYVEAAAPLLLAKPLAENELLRVALGAANDDREAAHERLAQVTAERERDNGQWERVVAAHQSNTLEASSRIAALASEAQRLREELQNIADAEPQKWDDFEKDDRDRQFRLWAQNRARALLAGGGK